MKKTLSSEKLFSRNVVDALLPYADKQLELIKDKLTPGTTYTSPEIVKIVGLSKSDTHRDEYIETELGTIAIASRNIFQQIKMCEKHAGLSGMKAHTWTVPDSREVAAATTMSFGSKRQMKELASIMKQRTRYDYEIIVFSLADGCLRPIINHCKYSPDDSRLKLQSIGYETPKGFGNLSFKFSSQQLKEMYGECRLFIYKDAKPDICCYLNPYHVRIVIENADGKCISSNEVIPITEEFIKIYDEQFTSSYEEDYRPTKVKEIIEEEHTDVANSQSAASDPSDSNLVIPGSSDNESDNLLHGPDGPNASDSKGIPTNVFHRLEPPRELPDCTLYQKGLITYIPPTPEDRLRQLEAERISRDIQLMA